MRVSGLGMVAASWLAIGGVMSPMPSSAGDGIVRSMVRMAGHGCGSGLKKR